MRLLELFCGTKSVGKVAEQQGYEVVSLDFEPRFNATHTIDIFDWDYKQYPVGYFNVLLLKPTITRMPYLRYISGCLFGSHGSTRRFGSKGSYAEHY